MQPTDFLPHREPFLFVSELTAVVPGVVFVCGFEFIGGFFVRPEGLPLGEVRTPSIADLFVALIGGQAKGAAA